MNRRKFHQAALATGAALAVGGQVSGAQTPTTQTRAQLLAALVQERYGKYLSEEQMNSVRQRLQAQIATGRALANTPFENGDEPDFVFTADV